jgi:hypothetical protein
MTHPETTLDIIGAQEIAGLLQVKTDTVHQWRKRGLLPAPDKRLAMGDIWKTQTIIDWAISTGRLSS